LLIHILQIEAIPGGRLLSASSDKTIILWDVNTQPAISSTVYKGHTDSIATLAVADTQILSAAGSRIGVAPIQEGTSMKIPVMRELKKMPLRGSISAMLWLSYSQSLLVGLDDGQIRVCI